jgi:uncharacterized membrane protein YdjX (TVP38/TMEM64 family)
VKKKIIILLLIITVVALYFVFDLGQYLNLQYLKASRQRFQSLYETHRFSVIAAYALIYIIVTSLSLPGAAVMTLAGGALFGLVIGTVVVSFSSTIGATLAFLVSRFLLRDWVQSKFGNRIKKINEGLEQEGKFYLFTLRLIPVFPFWLINLAMGLTNIRTWTFYWVSQVGMLAGTVVYVNAGTQLARIESLKGILSPGIIISFSLLGLFPLIAKKAVGFYNKRRKISVKKRLS